MVYPTLILFLGPELGACPVQAVVVYQVIYQVIYQIMLKDTRMLQRKPI